MTHKYFLRSRTRFISESSEGNSSESSDGKGNIDKFRGKHIDS